MTDRAPSPGGSTFAADYRVRFDEAGADGHIRTSTLLRYAQDVAWLHSEHRGFDRRWYGDRGLNWVVRAVELEVIAPVTMWETLRVSTTVIGHRRIWARRLAEVRLVTGGVAADAPAASVVTDWVILGARGRPVRIPTDFGLDFASPELHTDIRRVDAPAGPPDATLAVRVRPAELDPMGHVNNAAYLDWLEEALLAADGGRGTANVGALPRRATLEYLASAGPGDAVEIATWRDGRSWRARIGKGAGDLLRAAGTLG